MAAIAGDAMTHAVYARQLLPIEMQQGAGIGMLITANGLDWFQIAEPVESAARQNALHGGGTDIPVCCAIWRQVRR